MNISRLHKSLVNHSMTSLRSGRDILSATLQFNDGVPWDKEFEKNTLEEGGQSRFSAHATARVICAGWASNSSCLLQVRLSIHFREVSGTLVPSS